MSQQTAQKQLYQVTVSGLDDERDVLVFTFAPNGLLGERGPVGASKRVPQFIVGVRQAPDGLIFDWSGTADDPKAAREEIETEIAIRMKDRDAWIERVTGLVDQVEQWGKELGWSTRHVEKSLDDARIGRHRVPALLMQQDTCRALLEPIGRSAPGADGVVDLYLMPAYDDIAVLTFYDNRWNLHYNMSPSINGVSPPTHAMPLSKEALEKVLVEMKQNAA
jgi:hypothetical protein